MSSRRFSAESSSREPMRAAALTPVPRRLPAGRYIAEPFGAPSPLGRAQAELAEPSSSPDVEVQSAPTSRFAADFSTVPARGGVCQTKLRVSHPEEPAEAEADRVADALMRAGPSSGSGAVREAVPGLHVQRKCAACAAGGSSCSACASAEEQIQRKPSGGPSLDQASSPAFRDRLDVQHGLAHRIRVLQTGGYALPMQERAFFEPRLGHDLRDVRIHTDTAAAESARALAAHAYTIGNHIVFASGRYAPGIGASRRLLAHELVHVIQQRAAPGGVIQRQADDRSHPPRASAGSLPEVAEPNVAAAEGVPSEKWSEQIEYQYRRRGDMRRAEAIRACRTQGRAACVHLLTASEMYRLWMLASSARGNRARIEAGLSSAAPVLAAAAAPQLAPTPAGPATHVRPPLHLVRPPVPAPAPAPTPTPTPGPGAGVLAARFAGPALVVTILVLAGNELWQLARFQQELEAQGFIILEAPLALCIGGCHASPSVPRFPTFPREPLPLSPPRGPFPAPSPDVIRDIERMRIRELPPAQTSPQSGPRQEPGPQPDTAPRQDRDRRSECQQQHPTALSCEEFADRDEVVIDFLINQGYSFDDLGDCRGVQSFPSHTIDACDGAPGETWHCRVNGTTREVSVFACLCCHADGSTGFEWRRPHWSVNLSRRGRR